MPRLRVAGRQGRQRIFDKPRPKQILRIPRANYREHKYVSKKDSENRGKYSRKKAEIIRKEDENSGLRVKNTNGYCVDNCHNCNRSSQDYMVWSPDSELVCTGCGAVQFEKYYEGAVESPQKLSSSYETRTYICERIRAFGNVEPRIPRQDARFIGRVYSELESFFCKVLDEEKNKTGPRVTPSDIETTGLKVWFIEHPADINKNFVKMLLKCCDRIREMNPTVRRLEGIDREDHVKFKTKYTERWLQIKIFLCGPSYYQRCVCDIPGEELLKNLYSLSMQIVTVYENFKEEANLIVEKKSIIKTDLIFLVSLYNLNPDYLETYSWYFYNDTLAKNPLGWASDYVNLQKILYFLNHPYPKIIGPQKAEELKALLYFDSWEIPPSLFTALLDHFY